MVDRHHILIAGLFVNHNDHRGSDAYTVAPSTSGSSPFFFGNKSLDRGVMMDCDHCGNMLHFCPRDVIGDDCE